MTDFRMWVSVNVAADILRVSYSTIKRLAEAKDLLCRKIGHSFQISRISICQNCLKESFPEARKYPLNCDTCQYFKPVNPESPQKSSLN